MPQLPTLTVTDAQAARITTAYGSTANYKTWLKKELIAFVFDYEARQIQAQATTDIDAKRTNVEADLGTAT